MDLLVAATAGHGDMTVLPVDRDFATLARVVTDLRERDVRDPPT
ncbi:PIN domain-containing protein [Kitasatospora indigofera]